MTDNRPLPSLRRERAKARFRVQQAAALAAYISHCDDILRAELGRRNGEPPDCLTLPLPSGPRRYALHHWLDELRRERGRAIHVLFSPPDDG